MTPHEQLVERFYRRLAAWYIVRQSVAAVTVWAFLWGTVVVVLRATQGVTLDALLWGLTGVPLAIAAATWSALRQLPDRAGIRALLDGRGDCGGLLMAGAERDFSAWDEAVPAVETPQVSWDGRRPLTIFATSIGYVLLGFLLPIDRSLAADSPLDINRETDRLAEQVRVLKEEKILDRERAETLRQQLDQLRKSSAGTNPTKTLEALDHLNDVVKQAARKASEDASREARQLGKLETAANALSQAGGLDEKEMEALMRELAAMTQKAAAENEQLKESLDADLEEALKEGKLSPEQLGKVASAAASSRESLRKSARRLFNAKLIDSDLLKLCDGECKCDGKELSEYLKLCKGKKSLGEALADLDGKGGTSEGPPGNTPIQFGDKSTENGAKFKEQALPPGALSSLQSQVTGVSGSAPKRDPKAGPPAAGSLTGAAAGGGSANTGQVLPQHKAAVERYFERSGK